MANSRVVLRIDASGIGTVEIDGLDLGHLTAGVHVHTCPGERTRVLLDLVPDEVLVDVDTDVRHLVDGLMPDGSPQTVPAARGRRAMTLRGPIV